MKVYFSEKKGKKSRKIHVKTIPKKYLKIESKTDCNLGIRFKDSKYKRLSKSERFNLEVDLLKIEISNQYQRELVQNEEPVRCEEVTANDRSKYYIVLLGKHRVYCPKELYDLSPVKGKSFRTK